MKNIRIIIGIMIIFFLIPMIYPLSKILAKTDNLGNFKVISKEDDFDKIRYIFESHDKKTRIKVSISPKYKIKDINNTKISKSNIGFITIDNEKNFVYPYYKIYKNIGVFNIYKKLQDNLYLLYNKDNMSEKINIQYTKDVKPLNNTTLYKHNQKLYDQENKFIGYIDDGKNKTHLSSNIYLLMALIILIPIFKPRGLDFMEF